jgi:hypothetical protein
MNSIDSPQKKYKWPINTFFKSSTNQKYVKFHLILVRMAIIKKTKNSKPDRVAHSYNPRYSGGRDQEDCFLRTVQAKSLQDPISTSKARNGGMGLSAQLCGKHK